MPTGLLFFPALGAAFPIDRESKAALAGQPKSLEVQPVSVHLSGSRARQQLVVTGIYPGEGLRDLTTVSDFSSEDGTIVRVNQDGFIFPIKNGTTAVVVRAGEIKVKVPVRVENLDEERPVSFRQEVVAALNVGGCNMGACHGTPSGKNGFRLSLRGFDPSADYLQLTRDVMGRRTSNQNPQASLILLKALGQIAHEGGRRFDAASLPAQTLQNWLGQGLPDDSAPPPEVQKIEILPGSRILHQPARWQQLAVLAHFQDGSIRDVTRLTVFSSSDRALAEVTPTGLVEFQGTGEVAILCRYLETLGTVNLAFIEPKKGFVWKNPVEANYVDRHVFAKLKLLNIQPSDLCSDQEFIRRIHLDLCAVLPTPAEVKAFLADKDVDKRAKVIDRLLERPEYADFWTLKWMDVFRASRKTLQLKGVETYRSWLRGHLAKNTPFHQVARELLTATGHGYENGPANYFRAARSPEELAETTAQLFLGVRMQCARCHNHPFEKWTQDDYYSTAAFFARVKVKTESGKKPNPKKAEAEIVFTENKGEVKHLRTGKVMPPRFLGGRAAPLAKDQDPRDLFADWLVAKENPFFSRSVVNRLWYHLMGRGIVDPPDDFRDSNPPANESLLDALAQDFIDHNFDVKHVLRIILNSRTYQASFKSNEWNQDDRKYFSHAVPRLLTAEQLLDALCQVTEVQEKFAGMPQGTRAVQLPDGESQHPFLKAFGQPARELPCECERDEEASLSKALQLVNGATLNAKLSAEKNRLGRLLASKMSDENILDELYLATLSRLPMEAEARKALHYVQNASDRRRAWEDVQWTLFNTREFMFRY